MGEWDALIIGGGQAGPPLAFALAEAGWRVALVERDRIGGCCVNFGCTPTKAAVASARLVNRARRGEEFGLRILTVEVDFAEVLAQAHAVGERARIGLENWFAEAPGGNPALLRGHGRFLGKDGERFRIAVGEEEHLSRVVVLNTGTRSRMPAIEGLSECRPITAENWLERRELPKRLAMIGGGVVSLELAQFYARMGSKVTVAEHGPQIAGTEDAEVGAALQELLEKEGIEFHLGVDLVRVDSSADGLVLHCAGDDHACAIDADAVFYSIGRVPNTDVLGLETVGVELDARGFVRVDEHLRSSVEGVYATGDIRPGYQLTSTSWDDFRVVQSCLIGDGSHTTNRVVPYAIYTDPQVGHVGAHEKDLLKAGTPYKTWSFNMSRNGLANEEREMNGFIRVFADPSTETVLGATVLEATGAEMVHAYAQLMVTGAPISVIRDAVMGHPTYAEAIQSAVS